MVAVIKSNHRGKTIGYAISGMLAIAASTGLTAWGRELRVADYWLFVIGDNKLAFDLSPMTIYPVPLHLKPHGITETAMF